METVLKAAIFLTLMSVAGVFPSHAGQDELHIPLATTHVNLDPTSVQDAPSLWVARQLHCQLVRMKGHEAIPEAAEQIRFLTPTLLRITLRQDVRFSNGQPVRAADVVATFELLRSSRLVLRNVFAWIDRVDAIDEKTVEFHLRRPIPSFLKFLGAPNYALMPRSFIIQARAKPELWKNPIGCGKYKVAHWDDAAGTIELSPIASGKRIIFHQLRRKPFSADEVLQFDILDAPFANLLPDTSGYREAGSFDPRQIYLALNTTLPVWRNRSRRCDLLARFNRNQIVRGYGPYAELPKSFFPRGVLGYAPDWKIPSSPSGTGLKIDRRFSLAFLEVSVPDEKMRLFQDTFAPLVGSIKTDVIHDAKHFGKDFLALKDDAMIFGLKSNYLDGYEFLLTFLEPMANVTGYDDPNLHQRIIDSQAIEYPALRARSYQEIASEIAQQCLILPVVTVSMRRVLVRSSLATPGLGEVPLNEYDLGVVQ